MKLRVNLVMNRSEPWYAVSCLFSHPTRKREAESVLYEERITLWRAGSFEEAFQKAETEAKEYAAGNKVVFLAVSNGFHLFDGELMEGAEVWSTMRGSNMDLDTYRRTFCCTPRDRSNNAPDFDSGYENS